jgi:SPP1 family predicted phage head-tail adaptor
MIDDVITLVAETVTGVDSNGNEIVETSTNEVFCRVRNVTRSEFYTAATANLHPEFVFILSDFTDYSGQKLVEYRGVKYSVIRTYQNTDNLNEIELTVERKIGNG